MSGFSTAGIPDLTGQTVIVTGASSGIGLETAKALTAHGARVILAVRDAVKGDKAAATLAGPGPHEVRLLDLASLDSVRAFATDWAGQPVDLLINNAGVMDIPYQRTEDGFELTLATNHLGPFALTGLLLDRLATGARVVTVSSVAHLEGVIDFDDLQAERQYDRERAYSQSKLANLLFTYELDRRLRAAGAGVAALACHPGVVYTELFANESRAQQFLLSPPMRVINFWAVHDVRMGALPELRAATDPSARGGEYFGPRRYGLRRRFLTGYPAVVESSPRSHDEADQARLWTVSEELTAVSYPALG